MEEEKVEINLKSQILRNIKMQTTTSLGWKYMNKFQIVAKILSIVNFWTSCTHDDDNDNVILTW